MSYFGLSLIIVGALVLFLDQGRDFKSQKDGLLDLIQDVKSLRGDFKKHLEINQDQFNFLTEKQDEIKRALTEADREIDAVQEHLLRVRKEQVKFRNTIAPRQINPKLKAAPQPVAVEIIPKQKKQFEKIKKQIDKLSR